VLISAAPGGLTLVRRGEERRVPAEGAGPAAHVALDPAYATDAVAAVRGPDVVVEVADPLRPVVFRAADDGTFTTRLMPVRLDSWGAEDSSRVHAVQR
jgi:DNA polymerase III beta subunit, C-terminal domain